MMKSTYGFGTSLKLPYDEAVGRVKDALKTEGFQVIIFPTENRYSASLASVPPI
jgi:uncharacterized protein (DUF302 family)